MERDEINNKYLCQICKNRNRHQELCSRKYGKEIINKVVKIYECPHTWCTGVSG